MVPFILTILFQNTDGKSTMGGVTLGVMVAIILAATVIAGGIALAALCARRRRSQPPHKHPPGDVLEFSDVGRRYVVAYTIKPSPEQKTPDPQPDILNAPGKFTEAMNTTTPFQTSVTVSYLKLQIF